MAKCPNCGEYVSPYAAGCALCGADLDALRRKREERSGRIPRPRWRMPEQPFDTQELIFIVILYALALFAPLFGFVLALVVALYAHSQANMNLRNAAAGAAALSVIWVLVARLIAVDLLLGL